MPDGGDGRWVDGAKRDHALALADGDDAEK